MDTRMIRFRAPRDVEIALQWDEASMRPAGLLYCRTNRGTLDVALPVSSARELLEDLDDRGESYINDEGREVGGPGAWDQPRAWALACRAAAKNLRTALNIGPAEETTDVR